MACRAAPATAPLWDVGDGLWAVITALLLLAAVMLKGSLVGDPALPNPTGNTAPPLEARDMFAITRNPMMWSVALWALFSCR